MAKATGEVLGPVTPDKIRAAEKGVEDVARTLAALKTSAPKLGRATQNLSTIQDRLRAGDQAGAVRAIDTMARNIREGGKGLSGSDARRARTAMRTLSRMANQLGRSIKRRGSARGPAKP